MVIYLDAANLSDIEKYWIQVDGFTTNPALMKKAGITNYTKFAKEVLAVANGKPVSFEVLADDWDEISEQAQRIQNWGDNVWVKIPVTNTKGQMATDFIDSHSDLNLNITAVMTWKQLNELKTVDRPHHIISVFCGRIQDAGKEPPFVRDYGFRAKFLWASTRQTSDIDKAWMGYHIYTLTPDLVQKLSLRGKDLEAYSLETVTQFYNDAKGIEF